MSCGTTGTIRFNLGKDNYSFCAERHDGDIVLRQTENEDAGGTEEQIIILPASAAEEILKRVIWLAMDGVENLIPQPGETAVMRIKIDRKGAITGERVS